MAYGRTAAAVGIGVATSEIDADQLSDRVIGTDFSIFSDVASASSEVELMNCEVIVLGNSSRTTSS
jgi:cyanuric acid amidohydrolase